MPDYNSQVKQALKGDYNAFEQVVEDHKDKVYRTCLLLLGSAPEGLEAAEQVFVTAYRSLRETEGKSVSEWIYRQAEVGASTLREELDRRGFPQRQNKADTLKTSAEIIAPPGFTLAIRERLALEAGETRKAAARRRLRSISVGIVAASVSLLAGWAGYQYISSVPEQRQEETPLISSPLPSPAAEAPPATPTSPSPPATMPPVPLVSPTPTAPLPAKLEQKPTLIPEIVVSNPKHDTSSPESMFSLIIPPLKTSPAKDKNTWVVELTDAQFWSMHKLLHSAYSKVRVPESAIPQGRLRTRIRLRFIRPAAAPKKAEPAREQKEQEAEMRSRLPIEDLLMEK